MKFTIITALLALSLSPGVGSAGEALMNPYIKGNLIVRGSNRSESIRIYIKRVTSSGALSSRSRISFPYVHVDITDDVGRDFTARFEASQVQYLEIYALGGDDTVDNDTPIPSHINGGDGADTLYGGSSDDVIMGEAGVDYLYGFEGSDRLISGPSVFIWEQQLHGGPGLDEFEYQWADYLVDGRFDDDDVSIYGGNNGELPPPDYIGSDGTHYLSEF